MFGKNIKKLRKVKGLSQQAFAELFSLKRAALGAYEEGRSNPKLETVLKIAAYFNIGVDELLQTELTVNRLSNFNDSLTTNTTGLEVEVFAQIPCITEALQVEFIQQHHKKTFTDKIPRLHLPLPTNIPYIAYTVSGLEMTWQGRGYFPRDIIIGKCIEKKNYKSVQPGTLVLVLTSGRLIFRRVYVTNQQLELKADYENVESIFLAITDVVRLWEICHALFYRLPPKTGMLEERLALLERDIQSLKA